MKKEISPQKKRVVYLLCGIIISIAVFICAFVLVSALMNPSSSESETKVDNTIVFFYAEFEKEQEENLKSVKVGDTITFEGKCLDAGNWTECELIVE